MIGREGEPIERGVLVQGAQPVEVLRAAVAQVASARAAGGGSRVTP